MDAVGLGEGTPLYGTNNLTMHYNGGLVSFQQFRGDDAYFEILGIREKQDNHTAEASWWFNEYAFREMGIDESANSPSEASTTTSRSARCSMPSPPR